MAVDPAYRRPPEPTPAVMSETVRQSRLDGDTLDTLAWTMLGEAANQGTTGMAAIAHVILNRAESGRYPSDPKAVALQNKQFSTWNEGQGGNNPKQRYPKSSAAFKQARQIAAQVLSGEVPDPTGGATHYWAPKGMTAMGYNETPYWADSERTRWGEVEIGDHIFLPRKPVPPGGIASPPIPADISASLQSRRNASDIGEGTTASELARFGQPGAAPVSMSDELGRETGRIRTIPTPRPRPTPPPPSTPITDAANIQPLTFKSPLESARAKLTAARQNGVTGSPIANVAAPNIDMARLSAETGRDIGRDGVTFDRTYDAGNRMSTPGLGSLLDARSFSPATPNPQRAAPPTGPSNRGRPASSAAPAPTGPSSRGRPVLSSAPSTPSGPANRGRPTSTASPRPIGPIGMTGTPGFAPAASPTNRTSPAQKTANGISGTAQMPLNARPSSPAVPKEPAYIVKKIQVLNPEWKEPVATDPLALERMEKAQTLNRYKPAPTVPKYITKTVTVANPNYAAPRPQAMPPALAASRMAAAGPTNALRAPVPATQSAALRSQRAATPPSSAREYEAANRAAKQRAIANSSNPTKTAARASLAARWGFD